MVSFPRSELDFACDDPRCPFDSVMTLYFATAARRLDGPIPAPTPAVPHASAHHDPILHWDSYSNLEINEDGKYPSFNNLKIEDILAQITATAIMGAVRLAQYTYFLFSLSVTLMTS